MSQESKSIADSAVPHSREMEEHSEVEKQQMQLGAEMEHEHGAKREQMEEQVEKLDE